MGGWEEGKDGRMSEGLFSFGLQVQWGRKFIGNYEPAATGEWGSKPEVMEGVCLEICIKILRVVGVALGGILPKSLTWA